MATFISAQRKVFEARTLKCKEDLAEIIGIMLGDGGIYYHKLSGKYHLTVAFNKKETQYRDYVRELFEHYFQPYRFQMVELAHEFSVRNISVFIARYLINQGLKAGNKTKLQVDIPRWIREDSRFMIRCVRGLFDTDGCVYRKYGPYAQIQFKFASRPLAVSLRELLVLLGFAPTHVKITPAKQFTHWKFYLSRQNEIYQFFTRIMPKNEKHGERYKKINGGAEI